MAKPQLENGYLRIAHELMAAVMLAGFNKRQHIVLSDVFDQIYGPSKQFTAILYPTAIASNVSTYRQNIAKAITELVDSNVLVRVKDAEYRFVKDYDRWTVNGRPRLNDFERAHCAARNRRNASTEPVSQPTDNASTSIVSQSTDESTEPVSQPTDTHKKDPSANGLLGVSQLTDGAAVNWLTPRSQLADANGECVGVPPKNPCQGTPAGYAHRERIENEERIEDNKTSFLSHPCDASGTRGENGQIDAPIPDSIVRQPAEAKRALINLQRYLEQTRKENGVQPHTPRRAFGSPNG